MANEKDNIKKPKEIEVSMEEGAAVTQHINTVSGGAENDKCSVCGSNQNNVERFVFQIPIGYYEPVLGIGRHAPAYITTCHNCGYIRFFNKIVVDQIIADSSKSENE